MSVGSVLTFWCREGYQLVGSDKISCSVNKGKAQWSNYLPVCEGQMVSLAWFGFTMSTCVQTSVVYQQVGVVYSVVTVDLCKEK